MLLVIIMIFYIWYIFEEYFIIYGLFS